MPSRNIVLQAVLVNWQEAQTVQKVHIAQRCCCNLPSNQTLWSARVNCRLVWLACMYVCCCASCGSSTQMVYPESLSAHITEKGIISKPMASVDV